MTQNTATPNSTTKGFMPTTHQSTLVYGEYKGFPLPDLKKYRPTNINKVNSFLALAIENNHNCYSFELYDDFGKFFDKLKKLDPTARYLKVGLDSYIKLVIFTKHTEAEVISILENYTDDFALKASILNVADNAVETASTAYEVAEHYNIPKHAKKDKQMTGNDLTADEKALSVVFELKPNIVRPT